MGFQKIIPYKNPRDGAGGSIGTSRHMSLWYSKFPPSVHRPFVVVVHTLFCQILCVASVGGGGRGRGRGRLHKFWARLDISAGFHCNRNVPLTYNEKRGPEESPLVFDRIIFANLAGIKR